MDCNLQAETDPFSPKSKFWTSVCFSGRQGGERCSIAGCIVLKDAIKPQHWYYHSSLWQWRLIRESVTLLIKKEVAQWLAVTHGCPARWCTWSRWVKKSKLMWLTLHCLIRKYRMYEASLGLNIRVTYNVSVTLSTGSIREIIRTLVKCRYIYKHPSPLPPHLFSFVHCSFFYSLVPMIGLSLWVVCLFFFWTRI